MSAHDASRSDAIGLLTSVHDLASPAGRVREDALTTLVEALIGEEPVDDATAHSAHRAVQGVDGPLATVGADEGDGSAFGRSFHLELLAILHHRNNESRFLAEDECSWVVELVERVAEREVDFRSFAEPHGWVHVVAHTADLVDEVLGSSWVSAEETGRLIRATALLTTRAPRVFDGGEEDRLAMALGGALSRGQLAVAGLRSLIGSAVEADHPSTSRRNWLMVVRSLWFRTGATLTSDQRSVLRELEGELTGLG